MNRHCILNRKLQSIIITFVFGLLTGVHMYCFMAGEAMVEDEWLYCFQSKRSGFMEGLITKMPQFHLLPLSDGKKTYVVGPERGQQIWISKGRVTKFWNLSEGGCPEGGSSFLEEEGNGGGYHGHNHYRKLFGDLKSLCEHILDEFESDTLNFTLTPVLNSVF